MIYKVIKIIKAGGIEEKQFIKKLAKRNVLEKEDVVKSVTEIINDVKIRGDQAVFDYTKRFDGVVLSKDTIKVQEHEIDDAYYLIDRKLLEVIRKAGKNIEKFHLKQKENSLISSEENGVILGQIINPLEVIGVYVPGGTAPLISSVLMNVIPARVAGVSEIIMATPPGKDGKVNPAILVAAREAGVSNIYKIGGTGYFCFCFWN